MCCSVTRSIGSWERSRPGKIKTSTNMQTLTGTRRIASIDFLRGAVMIIMALDHVRDYFHADAFLYDPLDLSQTNGWLFFTRWITHFCAPVFMFLAGTSAFLVGQRKSKKELSLFLLKRGIWLIILEFTLINFAWNFDIAFNSIYFIVIWALGLSMVIMAALIYLPLPVILLFGLLLTGGHNLLDNTHVPGNTLKGFGWSLFHELGFFTAGSRNFLIGYPIVPWVGVMALGYCAGSLYKNDVPAETRRRLLRIIGISAIVLFIIVRLINSYGDPSHWEKQATPFFTFLSFINVTKYPPSLLYLLLMLGPALIMLSYTENVSNAVSRVVSVYGRVPMLYYILHLYFIHVATLFAAEWFTSFSWRDWIMKQPLWFAQHLQGYGFSLTVTYIVWIAIVLLLYPICKWYDGYKSSHKEKWWLSYL